jgi:biopolymer transport protein ExbD
VADAGAEGTVVVVSTSAILLDGTQILRLPSRAELVVAGVEAKHKRGGNRNDLYIVTLGDALLAIRASDKTARHGALNSATVVADPSTPYRLLLEVLFTLGQSEFGGYHLMALGATGSTRSTTPPSLAKAYEGQPGSGGALTLKVWITDAGIAVKTSAGNVAPGCTREGPGLTLPRTDAGHDLEGLSACAERLKGARPELSEEREVLLAANASIDFATTLSVMDALRERGGKELFPDVHFGVAR